MLPTVIDPKTKIQQLSQKVSGRPSSIQPFPPKITPYSRTETKTDRDTEGGSKHGPLHLITFPAVAIASFPRNLREESQTKQLQAHHRSNQDSGNNPIQTEANRIP